jgi:hypothetical protein
MPCAIILEENLLPLDRPEANAVRVLSRFPRVTVTQSVGPRDAHYFSEFRQLHLSRLRQSLATDKCAKFVPSLPMLSTFPWIRRCGSPLREADLVQPALCAGVMRTNSWIVPRKKAISSRWRASRDTDVPRLPHSKRLLGGMKPSP